MDADDRGDPDRFKKLLDALTQHPDWTAVCSQVRIFGTVSEAQGRERSFDVCSYLSFSFIFIL